MIMKWGNVAIPLTRGTDSDRNLDDLRELCNQIVAIPLKAGHRFRQATESLTGVPLSKGEVAIPLKAGHRFRRKS